MRAIREVHEPDLEPGYSGTTYYERVSHEQCPTCAPYGHIEFRVDGVAYKNLTPIAYPKRRGTYACVATVKGKLIPGAAARLAEAVARLPPAPIDPLWGAAVYAVDQITLAGGAPYDAWDTARWLVDQHGGDVRLVFSYTIDLWYAVTGISV
jgi:hypothetical protein